MGSFSRRNRATLPKTLEGSGPLSLFRMRKGLTFKGEEPAHFQGGTGPLYPKPRRVLQ